LGFINNYHHHDKLLCRLKFKAEQTLKIRICGSAQFSNALLCCATRRATHREERDLKQASRLRYSSIEGRSSLSARNIYFFDHHPLQERFLPCDAKMYYFTAQQLPSSSPNLHQKSITTPYQATLTLMTLTHALYYVFGKLKIASIFVFSRACS